MKIMNNIRNFKILKCLSVLVCCVTMITGFGRVNICHGQNIIPIDVMLVVDTSATMGDNSKLSDTKTAIQNFSQQLALKQPDSSILFHQVGLVTFGNTSSQIMLNKCLTSSVIGCDHVFNFQTQVHGYLNEAVGYRRIYTGLPIARNNLQSSSQIDSKKVMIVITDGVPNGGGGNNISTVQNLVNSIKDDDVRVIVIGVNTNNKEIRDINFENYIQSLSSSASDCYYIQDEDILSGQNNKSCSFEKKDTNGLYVNLQNILATVIQKTITDESPIINFQISPSLPLFVGDNIKMSAEAIDDNGFKSFTLRWKRGSGVWQEVQCDDLGGKEWTDSGGVQKRYIEIPYQSIGGGLAFNEEIDYEIKAVDAYNKQTVTWGNVGAVRSQLLTPAYMLKRNKNNRIILEVEDPDNLVYNGYDTVDKRIEFWIDIANSDGSNNIFVKMNRVEKVGAETKTRFYYDFNPGCDWRSSINPLEVYSAKSGVWTVRDVVLNLTFTVRYNDSQSTPQEIERVLFNDSRILTNSDEGIVISGTCNDSINNDCNFSDIHGNFGYIDIGDWKCDNGGPDITLIIDSVTDLHNVLVNSQVTDSNGVKENSIYYKKKSDTEWMMLTECVNNGAGQCMNNLSQNIDNVSQNILKNDLSILVGAGGGVIEFKVMAVDSLGNSSEKIEEYIVLGGNCVGRLDGESCYVVGSTTLLLDNSKCCGGVCNTMIVNPYGYDIGTACATDQCMGTDWVASLNTSNIGGLCTTTSGQSAGCYALSNPKGCEERSYKCNNGRCAYVANNIKYDKCIVSGTMMKAACNGNKCEEEEVSEVCTPSENTHFYIKDKSGVVFDPKSAGATIIRGYMLESMAKEMTFHARIREQNIGSSVERIWMKWAVNDNNNTAWKEKVWYGNSACPSGNCDLELKVDKNNNTLGRDLRQGDVLLFFLKVEIKDNLGKYTYINIYNDNQLSSVSELGAIVVVDDECAQVTYPSTGVLPAINAKNQLGGCSFEIDAVGGGVSTVSGKCCGGYCRNNYLAGLSFDPVCRYEGCEGSFLTFLPKSDGDTCSMGGGCVPYYNGCRTTSGACLSGLCSAANANQADKCAVNTDNKETGMMTDYACDGTKCKATLGVDCAIAGVINGCQCGCGGRGKAEEKNQSFNVCGGKNVCEKNTIQSDLFSLNNSETTWELWTYVPSSLSGKQILITEGEGGATNWIGTVFPEAVLYFDGNNLNARFCFQPQFITGNSHCLLNLKTFSTSELNKWHHIVITLGDKKFKLYVNGVLIGEKNATYQMPVFTKPRAIPFKLFGFVNGGTYFKGGVDEVRVYNRVLSAPEIKDHYKGVFVDNSNLELYWDFEDVGANVNLIQDKSGKNHNGTYEGSMNLEMVKKLNLGKLTPNNIGKFDKGLDLTSNDNTITEGVDTKNNVYGYIPEYLVNLKDQVSFAVWFKTNQANGAILSEYLGARKKIVGGVPESDTSLLYGYYLIMKDGYLQVCVSNEGLGEEGICMNTTNEDVKSLHTVNDDKWHQAVVTYNTDSGVKLYIDGVLQGEKIKNGGIKYSRESGNQQYLGFQGWVGGVNEFYHKAGDIVSSYCGADDSLTMKNCSVGYFRGYIDELQYYKKALTAEQVRALYYGVKVFDNSDLLAYWSFDELPVGGSYRALNYYNFWNKHYFGSIDGSVPSSLGVCTDAIDNNCNSKTDNAEVLCDGRMDNFNMFLTTEDEIDKFGSGLSLVEVNDVVFFNNERFDLYTEVSDEFGIKETSIEWTVDGWQNTQVQKCSNSTKCRVCLVGNGCFNEDTGVITRIDMLSNYLEINGKGWYNNEWSGGEVIGITNGVSASVSYSGNDNRLYINNVDISKFNVGDNIRVTKSADIIQGDQVVTATNSALVVRACAWDINLNKTCSPYRVILAKNTNRKPEVKQLQAINPDFCQGLKYKFIWDYSDVPNNSVLNKQSAYEIHFKERGTVNWLDLTSTAGSSPFYVSDGSKFEFGKTYEWRARVKDSHGSTALWSDWVEGPIFAVPKYEYPDIAFGGRNEEKGEDCKQGGGGQCKFGEQINFASTVGLAGDCRGDYDCNLTTAVQCNNSNNKCESCTDDAQCKARFGGSHWVCDAGKCQAVTSAFTCNANSDCKARDLAHCNATSKQCEVCVDNNDCAHFQHSEIYTCGVNNKCINGNSYEIYESSCGNNSDCVEYNKNFNYICSEGVCEKEGFREWNFDDGTKSAYKDPKKIFIKSEKDVFRVGLKITDVFGHTCTAYENIVFGGRRYPQWNETDTK